MAKYEHVTRYIAELEDATAERLEQVLYEGLCEAFYQSRMLDMEYIESLEDVRDIRDGRFGHANIEALDIDESVRRLSLVMYADHLRHGNLMAALEDGYLLRILRRIAELDGTWTRPNVVTFYHEYEKDGYLSNWYEATFRFGPWVFPTSEHWMMWNKAQLFWDRGSAEKILMATSMDDVKKLGKQVKPTTMPHGQKCDCPS